MSRNVKIALFIAILLVGSFIIYAISPLVTYAAVVLTGQGWLFPTLRWMILFIFWAIMFWKFWPKR